MIFPLFHHFPIIFPGFPQFPRPQKGRTVPPVPTGPQRSQGTLPWSVMVKVLPELTVVAPFRDTAPVPVVKVPVPGWGHGARVPGFDMMRMTLDLGQYR